MVDHGRGDNDPVHLNRPPRSCSVACAETRCQRRSTPRPHQDPRRIHGTSTSPLAPAAEAAWGPGPRWPASRTSSRRRRSRLPERRGPNPFLASIPQSRPRQAHGLTPCSPGAAVGPPGTTSEPAPCRARHPPSTDGRAHHRSPLGTPSPWPPPRLPPSCTSLSQLPSRPSISLLSRVPAAYQPPGPPRSVAPAMKLCCHAPAPSVGPGDRPRSALRALGTGRPCFQ